RDGRSGPRHGLADCSRRPARDRSRGHGPGHSGRRARVHLRQGLVDEGDTRRPLARPRPRPGPPTGRSPRRHRVGRRGAGRPVPSRRATRSARGAGVTAPTIKVLVVDDDYRVAGLHADVVTNVPGFAVVGMAHTASAAADAVRAHTPDLVLLDIYLPDESGL